MATSPKAATRQEKDSIGPKEIPAHVYYGVQTARAVENYPISGMRAHPTLIKAFGMVKLAATEANKELGLIDNKRADAIIAAAREVIAGKWDQEFVVDVFQAILERDIFVPGFLIRDGDRDALFRAETGR